MLVSFHALLNAPVTDYGPSLVLLQDNNSYLLFSCLLSLGLFCISCLLSSVFCLSAFCLSAFCLSAFCLSAFCLSVFRFSALSSCSPLSFMSSSLLFFSLCPVYHYNVLINKKIILDSIFLYSCFSHQMRRLM
jgi:hypothetical protein